MKTLSDLPYLLPSLGGESPICNPRGPPHIPQATKNTTTITKFGLAIFFCRQRGKPPLKTIKVKSLQFVLPWHCPGVTHHPSITPGAPIRTPKQPNIPQSRHRRTFFLHMTFSFPVVKDFELIHRLGAGVHCTHYFTPLSRF